MVEVLKIKIRYITNGDSNNNIGIKQFSKKKTKGILKYPCKCLGEILQARLLRKGLKCDRLF